jgi:transcriptional regulator with XRE-family HTH domain
MDEKLRKERGMRLADLRRALKLSQPEVAAAAGIALSSYSQLETGKAERNFREEIFTKVAQALKTTADYIMFGTKRTEGESASQETTGREFLTKNPEDTKIRLLQNDLIRSLLEIDDITALQRLSASIDEQKEYAILKKQVIKLSQKDKNVSIEEGASGALNEMPSEEKADIRPIASADATLTSPGKKRGRKKKIETLTAPRNTDAVSSGRKRGRKKKVVETASSEEELTENTLENTLQEETGTPTF